MALYFLALYKQPTMPDSVNVHLRLTIDGTEVEAAVPVPAGRSPRRVLLPVLRGLTDTVVRIAEQAAGGGGGVSCRKGCDSCCRQMVPISATEAYGLAETMGGMDPQAAAEVMERFDVACERLEEAGLLGRLERRAELSAAELQQLDRDYFAAGVGCPFLVDHACSIHAERPLACREFLVTSPAEFCANPTGDRVRQVELGAKVSVALASREEQGWLPLVLARHFVARYPEKATVAVPAEELQGILRAL
jgi:Fe-S-cluster containining protein